MRPTDRQTIEAFALEVREDVALIVALRDVLERAPGDQEALRETYRLVHAIKGSSAMVGLSTFSHAVYRLEAHLELFSDEAMKATPELLALIHASAPHLEAYLDAWLAQGDTTAPVVALVQACRRFEGAPAEGDAADVQAMFESGGEQPSASWGAPPSSDVAAGASPVPTAMAPALAPAPAPAPVLASEDVRMPADASPELVEIFMMEAAEHLEVVSRRFGVLASDPGDRESLQEVRRSVHTLKGAAGMVGLRAVAQLSHRMEDLLDRLYEDQIAPDAPTMTLLRASGDALEDLVHGTCEEASLCATVEGLLTRYTSAMSLATSQAPSQAPWQALSPASSLTLPTAVEPYIAVPAHAEAVSSEPIFDAELVPVAAAGSRVSTGRRQGDADTRSAQAERRGAGNLVRVPFERLDDLVKLVGELVINRSTFEQHFGGFIKQVDELGLTIGRLKRVAQKLESEYEVRALATTAPAMAYAGVGGGVGGGGGAMGGGRLTATMTHGFDELEFDRYTEFHLLSRELMETAGDINTVGNRFRDTIRDFESDLTRLGRLTGEVQDRVMQFRMVPLATIATKLERTVRTTATTCQKLADFVLEGEDVALDKTVLEEMADPLLHLLRNCVDHGLETPAVRRAAGKPEQGQIRVRAFHQGTQVVIQIADDGAGLNVERIRAKAVERGLVSDAVAAGLSQADLLPFIFQPGFSTAASISEVSGRGVGLDVVKANVQRLKGEVSVDSTPGRGARFTIRLPLTLAIARVLLVRAGDQVFATPLAAVEQISKVNMATTDRIGDDPVVRIGGLTYPIVRLSDALGLPTGTPEDLVPVIIGKDGDRRVAFAVDEILESRDAVVKTLGAHLRRVHGVTGATLLGDGSVVLILNLSELGRVGTQRAAVGMGVGAAVAGTTTGGGLTVLVVDDSLSMRHMMTQLVQRAGWTALQARDDLDALEVLHRTPRRPDAMLVDIEMPRMDGYELTSTLRSQALYRDMPIVMVTSRAGDKHRQKGLDSGATEYWVKPIQEDQLVARVKDLVGAERQGAGGAA